MKAYVELRAQRIAMGVVVAGLGLVGLLPLFGGPGYEFALATGLLVPTATAITAALDVRPYQSPVVAILRGVGSGAVLAFLAWAMALAHGVRSGFCDLVGGSQLFVLGPVVGILLAGAWGAVVSQLCQARRRGGGRVLPVVLAVALPLGSAAFSVGRFYTSPIIFAFDPFVGYFSGTLYDTVIDAGTPLLTYRLGSLLTLFAVVLTAAACEYDHTRTHIWVFPRSNVRARACMVVAGMALVASIGITMNGNRLGHWQTSASIAAELGGRLDGRRCDVIYPNTLTLADARLLQKDCEEELTAVEGALGVSDTGKVTAFFFRDVAEKKRLMGAANTFIAKPWRHEIYLQIAGYPHPVLGHELAHVVAGSFGRGPFRIAGGAGGLIPNPGLIEGVAVATSPDDGELQSSEWAHAMMDLGILPAMRSLFSMDFLGGSAAKSYTLAGAFVRFVMNRFGVHVVRAWYAGHDIQVLTGQSWSDLDKSFRDDIVRIPLPPGAAPYAKAKFEGPGIFRRKCPHAVDALRRRGDGCRETMHWDEALGFYHRALERDHHDSPSRYGLGYAQLWRENGLDSDGIMREFVADESVPTTWRDRGEEALGDRSLVVGRPAEAKHRYQAVAARTLDEDVARTLEVKLLAAENDESRAPIVALLLGSPHRPVDPVLAASLLAAWVQSTDNAVGDYLLGRNLAQRGWYHEGSRHLDRALAHGLPTLRLDREALRQRAICACALGDAASLRVVQAILNSPSTPFVDGVGGRFAALQRLIRRCSVSQSN